MNEPQSHLETIVLDKKLSRRKFLETIIKGGFLATIAGFIFPALSYLWPVTQKGPAVGRKEVGALDEIPLWGAKKVIIGGSAILLVRTPDGVNASSAICTHLGCIVDWDDKKRQIVCPCHAGIFDYKGKVISGPPPKALPSYAVNIINDKIFVTI